METYCDTIHGTALKYAIQAAGLAAIANCHVVPDFKLHAERIYSRALGATNAALMDPKTAVSDVILVTVMLLGAYEVPQSPMVDCRS